MPDLRPLHDLAAALDLDPETLRRWIRAGRLAAEREPLPNGSWRYVASLDDARNVAATFNVPERRGRPRKTKPE